MLPLRYRLSLSYFIWAFTICIIEVLVWCPTVTLLLVCGRFVRSYFSALFLDLGPPCHFYFLSFWGRVPVVHASLDL